jgi:methyl-accepting chemotaxis protein
MKLRTKLILGFGLVALVTFALGIFTMLNYFNVREENSMLNEDIIPGALFMLETNAAVKSLLVEVQQMASAGETEHWEHAEEAIARIQENTTQHTAHEMHVGDEEGRAAQDMEDRAARIIDEAERIIIAVEAGGSQAEIDDLLRQMYAEAEALEVIFEEHVAEHMIELAETQENVGQTIGTGIQAIWIAIVVAVVLSIGVGLYFVNSFTKPVKIVTRSAARLADHDLPRLVQAIRSASEGDLTTTYQHQLSPQLVEVKSRDEIGQMAQAFNSMNAALSEVSDNFVGMLANWSGLINQVQLGANQVASASAQLNASAEQAGRASQQVASTSQQVANGTSQQTKSVTEATLNVEQMARAAQGVARGSQEQAKSVQATSQLITEMADIVDDVRKLTETITGSDAPGEYRRLTAAQHTSIRSRTASAVEKVKEMDARSREIGRIVETIDEIADKTDMLALNAAVEAARAGEYGRGFAVVADQVRKLSEDSKEATRDITMLIERVQSTVNDAIIAMEGTSTEVDKVAIGLEQAMAQLRQKSEGVVAAIESVSTVVEENTAVAEEMAANTEEVTTAMEGVASIAEENSASTEEVSASAEEMSAQVEEVVASAEELSALAEELRLATVRFRVEKGDRSERAQSAPGSAPFNHPSTESVPVLGNGQDDGLSFGDAQQ